jgi:hypothetical protein
LAQADCSEFDQPEPITVAYSPYFTRVDSSLSLSDEVPERVDAQRR